MAIQNLKSKIQIALVLALVSLMTGCGGEALPVTSWAGLMVSDGVAYMSATSQVMSIGTSDGAVHWTFKSQVTQPGLFGASQHVIPVHADPAIYGELVFVGSDGQSKNEGRVRALEVESGQVRWQFPPEDEQPIGNIFAGLVAQEETVYLVATDELYALKTETGAKLWSVPLNGRVWGTPLLADGRLYVGTLNHKLFALDVAEQGKTIWEFDQAQGGMAGSPVLSNGTLYVGSFDNYLYALDAETGRQQWRYDARYWIWDGVTVISDTVYVGDLGGYVQALGAQDGQPRWSQPAKVEGAVRATPLYIGDALIVATDAGNVYALDPGNGSVRWVVNAPSSRLLTRPVLDKDTLLLSTLSGPVQLYGVDIAALSDAYQQQEIKASGRAPVTLYKENQVNADVVRWHISPTPGK